MFDLYTTTRGQTNFPGVAVAPGAASGEPLLEVLGCERPSVSELFTKHRAGLGFMDDGQ